MKKYGTFDGILFRLDANGDQESISSAEGFADLLNILSDLRDQIATYPTQEQLDQRQREWVQFQLEAQSANARNMLADMIDKAAAQSRVQTEAEALEEQINRRAACATAEEVAATADELEADREAHARNARDLRAQVAALRERLTGMAPRD